MIERNELSIFWFFPLICVSSLKKKHYEVETRYVSKSSLDEQAAKESIELNIFCFICAYYMYVYEQT